MIAQGRTAERIDTKALLSTLWIVVMFNMLKADILSLYIPGALDELVKFAGETPITQIMLAAAVLMELSIAMILLARVLPYRLNRWANILVALFTIVFIAGGGSMYPHYLFIAAVEIVCLLAIIGIAWRWSRPVA